MQERREGPREYFEKTEYFKGLDGTKLMLALFRRPIMCGVSNSHLVRHEVPKLPTQDGFSDLSKYISKHLGSSLHVKSQESS